MGTATEKRSESHGHLKHEERTVGDTLEEKQEKDSSVTKHTFWLERVLPWSLDDKMNGHLLVLLQTDNYHHDILRNILVW